MFKTAPKLWPLLLLCGSLLAQSPDVTLTGTIQGPNGLPLANTIISLTPTQNFYVAGSTAAVCNSYIVQINGTALTCGDTINFNNTLPAAPANGLNVTWAKSTAGAIDSVSAAVVGDGNALHCLLGTGVFNTCPSTGFPGAPQVGDIIRYNVNGDSAWDAVNQAQVFMGIYAWNQTGNSLAVIGPFEHTGTTPTGIGNTVNPTATLQTGLALSSSSSASTSTVIGFSEPQNGNVSLIGMTAFYRISTRFSIANLTNARYWLGLGCYNSSGLGNNPATIVGSTGYAADAPNKTTIGFRYSAGTDTHWQAVTVVAGGAQTTVDTGIVPDTAVHLFEMVPNAAGTSIFFFIDSAPVATISTNIPLASGGGNSWGSLFMTGDNKNTATSVALTIYSMQVSLKL